VGGWDCYSHYTHIYPYTDTLNGKPIDTGFFMGFFEEIETISEIKD